MNCSTEARTDRDPKGAGERDFEVFSHLCIQLLLRVNNICSCEQIVNHDKGVAVCIKGQIISKLMFSGGSLEINSQSSNKRAEDH